MNTEKTYILQEYNDFYPHNSYWFDDEQPEGTEKSLDALLQFLDRDRRNKLHYASCKHRIVMREETEIPYTW